MTPFILTFSIALVGLIAACLIDSKDASLVCQAIVVIMLGISLGYASECERFSTPELAELRKELIDNGLATYTPKVVKTEFKLLPLAEKGD